MPEGLGRRCMEECDWVLLGAYLAVLCLGFELAKPTFLPRHHLSYGFHVKIDALSSLLHC